MKASITMEPPRTTTGYRLPARSADGPRSRQAQDPRSLRSVPRSMIRIASDNDAVQTSKPTKPGALHSRLPSRVVVASPSCPPSRPPSDSLKVLKPAYNRLSKSNPSSSSLSSSSCPGSRQKQTQPASSSSSSKRSLTFPLPRPGQCSHARNKSTTSHEAQDLRNDAPIPKSPPSPLRRPLRGIADSNSDSRSKRGVITENPGRVKSPTQVVQQQQQQQEEVVMVVAKEAPATVIYPELDRFRNQQRRSSPNLNIPFRLATHDLPPPTPIGLLISANSSGVSTLSASPSARFFESLGPGPYSRDTTPTSTSSQSPGLIAPSRIFTPGTSRLRSPSLSRPPVTRRRTSSISNEVDLISADPHGLAAVRESLTSSSSSNSTVREGDRATSKAKTPTDIVPESSPPLQASPLLSVPPARPSRDGAPDLYAWTADSLPTSVSTVRSKLPPKPFISERRGSESAVPRPTRGPLTMNQKKSASLSSLPTGGGAAALPSSSSSSSSSSASASASASAKSRSQEPNVTSAPLRSATPSLSVGALSQKRFPMFGRKKAVPEKENMRSDSTTSPARKGPVAGTGHEGYGKIGAVRRRSGVISNTARPLLGYQSSLEPSPPPMDAFLADRINPVIIAGGSVIENRNNNTPSELTRTESPRIVSHGRPSTDSKASSVISSSSSSSLRKDSRLTLSPPTLRDLSRAPALRRPSDGSDPANSKTASAHRQLVQRLESSSRPARTINANTSATECQRTSTLSDESSTTLELRSNVSREPELTTTNKLKKKRTRSPRRWNFFGRSKTKSSSETKNEEKVAVTVMPVQKRPIPFYAIMEPSENEDDVPMNVQTALQQAEVFSQFHVKHASPATIRAINAPSIELSAAATVDVDMNPRPSRLAQVGRIPQVVSSRPAMAGTQRSFSRPFANIMHPLDHGKDVPVVLDSVTDHRASSMEVPIFVEPSSDDAVRHHHHLSNSFASNEFLSFPVRKNSSCSSCSSSTDSAKFSFDATAIIPRPSDPPAEDEIWDEYNDLFGDDNLTGHRSTTSSWGIPFHLEKYRMEFARDAANLVGGQGMSFPTDALTTSARSAADMAEEITAAFQPQAGSPSSPRTGRHSGSCSSSSEEWSPSAQVNLRVGSMTVSKWLTFGHVLFSDIRHSLADTVQRRPSILVIDGLNEDWSFYAAETHPGADFFSLSARDPLPAESGSGSGSGLLVSPPNHHQIRHSSLLDKLPLASHSFSCVVYRFPVAAPETHYENVLKEARRVLKPGGHIEMSILDVDLNNMGHRGRRAVRQLKERIYGKSSETNLASAADLVVRLLGRGGFSSIKAARVGIPVASAIARSSIDSTCSGLSVQMTKKREKKKKAKVGDQPSLAEMVQDYGPSADEGITSMVARVGRWWYSRCYETGEGSVWSDGELLRECEEMGTSLKLMVCCARSPF